MNNEAKLNAAVIDLHDIARLVEQEIGTGLLSEDIRDCADRLSQLLKKELANEY